jgi:hypothetical protein
VTERPTLPGDWTEPETWAWQRIAAGEQADCNARADAPSHSAPGDQFGTDKPPAALVQHHWLIGYFYGHKVIGWPLGLFLGAGLAGLTQRT